MGHPLDVLVDRLRMRVFGDRLAVPVFSARTVSRAERAWGLRRPDPPTQLSWRLGPGSWADDDNLVEARPGGSKGDAVGYSDSNGRAATLSRHRAGSVVLFEGPCAALDVAPPDEPPERTSGIRGGSRGSRAQGPRSVGMCSRLPSFRVRRGALRNFCQRQRGTPSRNIQEVGPGGQDPRGLSSLPLQEPPGILPPRADLTRALSSVEDPGPKPQDSSARTIGICPSRSGARRSPSPGRGGGRRSRRC